MSLTLLFSAHPAPGRIVEARTSLADARSLLARHCPNVNQWRAEIAGANTGTLYTSLTWDIPSQMATGQEGIYADPAYAAWSAKQLVQQSIVEASPNAMLGLDVPGFLGAHLPANATTTPRICSVIALQLHDELLALLPQSKARADRYGYGWACRVWTTGTGSSPIVAVYNVYSSRTAWGSSQDQQMAEYGSDPVMRLVRPFILSRSQLVEIL
jgi:hypothetical protein